MGEFTAFCTMVVFGYMGAPPTFGSFCAEAVREATASVTAVIDASKFLMIFFIVIPLLQSLGFAPSRGRDRERPSSLRAHFETGLEESSCWAEPHNRGVR